MNDMEQADCPLGGDTSKGCADCIYFPDFHFVNGECVRRSEGDQ